MSVRTLLVQPMPIQLPSHGSAVDHDLREGGELHVWYIASRADLSLAVEACTAYEQGGGGGRGSGLWAM